MYVDRDLEDRPGEDEPRVPIKRPKLSHCCSGSSSSESKSDRKVTPRRGRPTLASVNNLIQEGRASTSSIKCEVCKRVFSKSKSLNVHGNIHSGKKFACDYPQCDKAFTQSGHLNTHHRLHTGEKPFVCTAEGCETCYKHTNRSCQKHPYNKLKRSDFPVKPFEIKNPENRSKDELVWLQKFYENKVQRQSRQKKRKRKLDRICVDSSSQISEVCSKNSTEDITSKDPTEEISSKNHTEISSRNSTEEISSRNSTEISSKNSTSFPSGNNIDVQSENNTSFPSGNNTEVQSENSTSFPSRSTTEVQSENRTVMSISQMTPLEKEVLITLASFSTATVNGWYCSNNVEQFSYLVNEYVDIHQQP